MLTFARVTIMDKPVFDKDIPVPKSSKWRVSDLEGCLDV